MRPDPGVLAAFGAHADPVPLPGGEGTAWRAGEIVLKPAGDPRVAGWTAGLYRDLALLTRHRDCGFRVPQPLSTATGGWVAGAPATGARVAGAPATGGWVAWQWLPGEPADWADVSPFWPRLIAASRAFHAALAGRPAPPWLGRDGSPWTAGDQVAWGERDPGSVLAAAPGSLGGQLRSLLAALRPVRLPSQLIHGDLGGNVLFADGEPPAVIDFSPYWRPAGLALAVAVVDALLWGGASPATLDEPELCQPEWGQPEWGQPEWGQPEWGQPEWGQLLARALVYRLVTEIVFRRGDPDPAAALETVAQTSQPVTVLVMAHLPLGWGHDGELPAGRDPAATGPAGPRPVPAAAGRGRRSYQAGGVRRRVRSFRSLATGRTRPGPGARHDGRGAVRPR